MHRNKTFYLMTFMFFNTFLFLLLMYKIEFGQNLPGSSLGKKTKLLKINDWHKMHTDENRALDDLDTS